MLNFKKVDTEIKKLETNAPFIGKFQGESTRPWVDEEGVEKEITQYHFVNIDLATGKEITDEKVVVFADAGLQNKFKTENVKEGQIVRITRGEKADLGRGGRKVNTYTLEIAQ